MLAAFLPPYPFRGVAAPYVWFYYRLLGQWTGERALFITGRDYVRPPADWAGRWECRPDAAQRLGYVLPEQPAPGQHHYAWLSYNRFESWLAATGNNPLAAFARFLTERDPAFEQELHALLSAAPETPELIITPCNVPSLAAVCAERGIALVHVELGALRGPMYRETGYLDFSGVNGNTECAARYLALSQPCLPLENAELLNFFLQRPVSAEALPDTCDHDHGVVLQVEDDSNLVAFANGMDNLSLITLARQQAAEKAERVLVRPHPGSRFALRPGPDALDDSPNSLAFVARCERVYTINSSVGLEAMLLGRPVQVLGENAFNFILQTDDPAERQRRLGFYLFAYLVPFSLQLSPEYLRFRLSHPAEQAIMLRHLREYMKQQQLDETLFEALPPAERLAASVLFANQHKQHELERQQLERDLVQTQQTLAEVHGALSDVEALRDMMLQSHSWRLTRPLRLAGRLASTGKGRLASGWHTVSAGEGRVPAWLRKGKKAARLGWQACRQPQLVLKGVNFWREHGWRQTLARLRDSASPTPALFSGAGLSAGEAVILTTPHCYYLAQLMQDALASVGLSAAIIDKEPKGGFGKALHFVICPQMFKRLPPLYIAWQMEQSVSSRWFTPEYIATLERAWCVFDYSLRNIEFLQQQGLSHKQLYYLPVGYRRPESLPAQQEEVDVLFYGDINNDRRRRYIARLQQHFSVKVVNNLFGEALYQEMAKARVVVNIHYYEGALLETTRLYECLSRQQIVVSEEGTDMDEHAELQHRIDFVPVNDIEAMVARVAFWVEQSAEARAARRNDIAADCEQQPNWFEFYFLRMLLAAELIDFEQFYQAAAKHVRFNGDFVCLGLPETVARRNDFNKDNHYGIEYFPGLRHRLGWVGCGLSYKFLLRRAKDSGLPRITICEDDVEFYPDFAERYQTLLAHLDQRDDWDLFAGLIAQLHSDLTVLDAIAQGEERFITIDKMVSMVMNVYSARFYDKLQAWNHEDHDAERNTIDRFIESHGGVRAITTPRFLVGHKEELNSTLWGFNNTTYARMIADSEVRLAELVAQYHHDTAAR